VTDRLDTPARDSSSFRDPAGYIFWHHGEIYRQVNKFGQADFDRFIDSGLYQQLVELGLIVAHQEVELKDLPIDPQRYKVIKPEMIPFVSYPYEWCFSQLKEAARLTLKIQKLALDHGLILKDASAYNIQFIGPRPVMIDSLSFRIYQEGAPWDGYRQFCEHFIAPLAVTSLVSADFLKNLRSHLDGLSLDTATSLLPRRAKLRRGLAAHVYLHAASRRRYDSAKKDSSSTRKVSSLAMNGLLYSLSRTVEKLKAPQSASQWRDYYKDTNYSQKAFDAKQKIVNDLLGSIGRELKMVWDLGANDGTFSQIAADYSSCVVAFDIDHQAVEKNFHSFGAQNRKLKILPLCQDLTNPSSSLGWNQNERPGLKERGPADVILALALIHHLSIGNNLSLQQIAEYFCQLAQYAIIEFIPKSDSRAKILLRRRANLFEHYSQSDFEKEFGRLFKILKKLPVPASQRVIYLLERKK